jgi:hypothetical protein
MVTAARFAPSACSSRRWWSPRSRDISFVHLIESATRNDDPFGDHFRSMLFMLGRFSDLKSALAQVFRREPIASQDFYRLRLASLVVGETSADARPRCQLYERYLSARLQS